MCIIYIYVCMYVCVCVYVQKKLKINKNNFETIHIWNNLKINFIESKIMAFLDLLLIILNK